MICEVVEKVAVTCDWCGAEVRKYKQRVYKRNFCDRRCRELYFALNKVTHPDRKPSQLIACEKCGKVFKRWPSLIHEHNFCSASCRKQARLEGLYKVPTENQSKHLVLMNQVPHEPGRSWYDKDPDRRMTHRAIAEDILGRKLGTDEVVHHIDFDKTNNDPSNLCVLSRSDHAKVHAAERLGIVYDIQCVPLSEVRN